MADATFVDESGTPYGQVNSQRQIAPQTILNHHPVIVDLQKDPGENRLEGELWVENAMVATFDTNNSPVFSFQSNNNNVFIQTDDIITVEIQKIDGSTLGSPVSRELETQRLEPQDLDSNLLAEVSVGRFVKNANQFEFKNEFNLTQFDFVYEIEDFINLQMPLPTNYGYQTPSHERDLSLGRKISELKNWLDF